MDTTRDFFYFLYQYLSLYPCVVLCYIPFTDRLRYPVQKIVLHSSLAVVFFSLLTVLMPDIEVIEDSAFVSAILFIVVGLTYYIRSVDDGRNKILFVFFVVVHAGSMGTELEYAVCTLMGVSAVSSYQDLGWYALFIPMRIILYTLVGLIMYSIFRSRLRVIKSEDMGGLWILPVFFAGISIYHGIDYYIRGTIDYFFLFVFFFVTVLAFFAYGLLLKTLDSMTKNALLEARAERLEMEMKMKEQALFADNAALDRLNRMKSELISTVSHETMTPLAVLSGYAELVAKELRRKGVDEQTARDLDNIAEETQRISHLIDELQNHVRQNDDHLSKTNFSITDLIDRAARLYTPILERKGIKIEIRIAKDLPDVYACASEITQVLFNLLQNSRNNTEGGTVVIEAEVEEKGYIAVSVSDTGCGIPPDILPRVLERGVSGSETGTGMGLFICTEIIKRHNGEIFVKNKETKGVTVRFTLPIGEGEVDIE